MNIFISHIHEEAIIATTIKKELLDNFGEQIVVFLAEEIPLGNNWFDEIKIALKKSDLIIVLFSHYSKDEPWINIEAGYGIMESKIVIPICCLGLKISQLPVVYSLYQSIEISNSENIRELLNRIARLTPANRLLGNIENSVNNFIHHVNDIEPRSLIYKIPHGEPPVIWLIGSHRDLSKTEQDKILDVADVLSQLFSEKGYQIVMGTSRLLNYIGDKITELNESLNIEGDKLNKKFAKSSAIINLSKPVPNPIILLGSLRSKQGIRHIFYDSIGKVPDIAIILGGSKEGRTKDEYECARAAGCPILSLQFTGGMAKECSSTFDEKLNSAVDEIQKDSNRMEKFKKDLDDLITNQLIKNRLKI